MNTCEWRMTAIENYDSEGKAAPYCGCSAAVRLIRLDRARDGRKLHLYLCLEHAFSHQAVYGPKVLMELLTDGTLAALVGDPQ